MKHEEKFPLIDAFLMDQISDEENQELNELRKNPEFDEEFEFRNQAYLAVKQTGRQQLKNRFRNLDQPTRIITMRSWWLAAAVAVILLIALPFIFQSPNAQDLYSAYYTKLPNKIVPITRGDTKPDQLKLGFVEYQRGNYEQALTIFEDQLQAEPDLNIYLAIIALEENRNNDAISILTNLSQDQNSRFYYDGKWYLALAYLAVDEEEKAKPILVDLSQESNRHEARSKELLSKLEN